MQTIVNDNLDLGCALIEKTATNKAIREIDEHLMSGYQVWTTLSHWCSIVSFAQSVTWILAPIEQHLQI